MKLFFEPLLAAGAVVWAVVLPWAPSAWAQPKKSPSKKETVARVYTPEERSRYTTAFLEATLKESQGYPDEALQAYEKLVETDPALHAARFRIAAILYERKEYAAAAAAVQKALLYDPHNAWYWRLSAQAHAAAGKFAEAAADYERAVKIARHPEDRQQLALLYLRLDKISSAAAQADSLGFFGARVRGLAMLKQKKYDLAAKELAAYTAMFPDQVEAYYELAETYGAAGKSADADAVWKKILSLWPNDQRAQNALAKRRGETGAGAMGAGAMGDPGVSPQVKIRQIIERSAEAQTRAETEEAVRWGREALKAHPGAEGVAAALAGAFLADAKTDSARKYFLLETRNAPANRAAWHDLLRADSALKDFAALYEHAEAFLELFPEDPAGHARLGAAAVETLRPEAAVSALERALKFQPENDDALEYLALACLKSGVPDKGEALSKRPGDYRVAKVYAEFRHGKSADECLKLLPETNEPYVLWTRGRILFQSERRNEGLNLLSRAADAQSRFAETAGDRFLAAGNVEKAVYYWRIARADGSLSAGAKIRLQR